ncbi:hypothetical protein KW842_10025 [Duganella sp. sic0402]|uniref:hypothetical protein n=1 Tax=Duganella sp. sic0402 TaxID=2854786 RepID=UPI001C446F37|nr:hypothetical protein [Duganella sp. sic0402]MBV7536101.1 hypothetical protein [Duganella sp. sic0402]
MNDRRDLVAFRRFSAILVHQVVFPAVFCHAPLGNGFGRRWRLLVEPLSALSSE